MEPRTYPPSPVLHAYATAQGVTLLSWHEPPPGTAVPEAVVQDVWARQALRTPLRTVDGRPVEVVFPGHLNTGGGPDFRAARLVLDGTLVVGDVEVHVRSSDWAAHRHGGDARYDGVVLHVTLHADAHTGTLLRPDGTVLPELVLAPVLAEPLRARVAAGPPPRPALPCAWGFPALPDPELRAWLRTLARLRLRRRVRDVQAAGPDLTHTLRRRVARTLGYRANADAFAQLGDRLPPGLLASLPDPLDREAVLLGYAGLLPTDDAAIAATAQAYVADLWARFVRHAPTAVPMRALSWNRARLRPAATPELRLAQFAALACPTGLLGAGGAAALAAAVSAPDPLPRLLAALTATPGAFWTAHYHFGRSALPHSASLGGDTVAALVANALAPVAVAAGASEASALRLVEALPAERDAVTALFALPKHAVRPSAGTSQALHEWHETFCAPGRCLDCPVGKALLKR